MDKQELEITTGTSIECKMPFMNFFTESGDFVAQICYIDHTQGIIKITRFQTANLVNNALAVNIFSGMGKKYPGLGTACMARFFSELRNRNQADSVILVSVPQALVFYRKTANRLLKTREIESWRQGLGILPLNKVPLWMIRNFGNISDNVFTYNL